MSYYKAHAKNMKVGGGRVDKEILDQGDVIKIQYIHVQNCQRTKIILTK